MNNTTELAASNIFLGAHQTCRVYIAAKRVSKNTSLDPKPRSAEVFLLHCTNKRNTDFKCDTFLCTFTICLGSRNSKFRANEYCIAVLSHNFSTAVSSQFLHAKRKSRCCRVYEINQCYIYYIYGLHHSVSCDCVFTRHRISRSK